MRVQYSPSLDVTCLCQPAARHRLKLAAESRATFLRASPAPARRNDLLPLLGVGAPVPGGRPSAEPGGGRASGAAEGRRLEYARHGRSIGGESPLEEEVVLTPSRRQLRRREAGWEGSPRRIPAPRNTNRVEGGAIWVSLLKKAKPVTIDKIAT